MKFNVLDIASKEALINILGHFMINGVVYENPMVKCRLMTSKEMNAFQQLDLSHPMSRIQISEDLIENAFKEFIGITDDVDWDNSEAGLIDIITDCIVLTSMSYIDDAIYKMELELSKITLIQTLQAVVSRFTSTSFDVVEQLPINELFKRYCICLKAFPREVFPISNQGDSEE